MNSLVTIIDKEGIITSLGNIDSTENIYTIDTFHSDEMHDYLAEKYFINLDSTSDDEYAYYLTLYGNIVYLNSGKFGIIYLPDNMKDIQKRSYNEFVKNLNQSLVVKYNMKRENETIFSDMEEVENGHTRLRSNSNK